jgi:CBS domain-containing protein
MTEPARQRTLPQPPPACAKTGDAMRPALTAVEPNDHLTAASYLMRHSGQTALVVVDDEETRKPVGLITEADIVQAVAMARI